MRKNYPRAAQRNPEEFYDHVYASYPDQPDISRIIDHRRKLVTINNCADYHFARTLDIHYDSHVPVFYEDA